MLKCKKCDAELKFVEGLGWLHPKSDCTEFDGIIVDDKARDVWNKDYPERIGSLIIKELRTEIIELEKELQTTHEISDEKQEEIEMLASQYGQLNELWQNTIDFRISMGLAYFKDWFKKKRSGG